MKAHDLARQLLAGPNLVVVTGFDDAPDYVTELDGPVAPIKVKDEGDGGEFQAIPLWYTGASTNYELVPGNFDWPVAPPGPPKTADEALAILRNLADLLAASDVEGVAAVGEAEGTNLRSVSGADYGFPTS